MFCWKWEWAEIWTPQILLRIRCWQCWYRSVWIICLFLGNTLAQIAEKKAGIIKDGCRVVTARQKPEAMQVIERISREHGTKCTIADASEAEVLKESCLGQTIRYRGEEYEIPLAGVYQKENAVVALNALKVLDELAFPLLRSRKKKGFAQ